MGDIFGKKRRQDQIEYGTKALRRTNVYKAEKYAVKCEGIPIGKRARDRLIHGNEKSIHEAERDQQCSYYAFTTNKGLGGDMDARSLQVQRDSFTCSNLPSMYSSFHSLQQNDKSGRICKRFG